METIRVDICYRPLRIGWAIKAGDIGAFRQAVRLSYTMWGGRFNPIIVVDHEEEARRLVDLFRVDILLPIGDSESAKEFPKRFPHLINPLFTDAIFIGGAHERKKAQVLDVHNALVHLRDTTKWKAIRDARVQIFRWQPDDPLADVFLVQFGAYPDPAEIGIDYRDMLMQAADAKEFMLDRSGPIPGEVLNRPSIAFLSRHGLERHHSVHLGWDTPGFFVGDVTNVDDLVSHWNLRASNISLCFVDPNYLDRYVNVIPEWETAMREVVMKRDEWKQHVAAWSRRENIDEALKVFGDLKLMGCPVSTESWNGRNVRPPMMHFGQISTLGVIGRGSGKPKVSFPLNEKPFSGDIWFHMQHLVASVSFIGGLYGDEHHTLVPPYIPELNEFYARTMHFEYNKLRIESARVGLIIDAADVDTFLYALPVAELFEQIFGMAGFASKLSAGGLIARQLIAQMGGLQGTRAFKIPGVRRLLKTHGPTAPFTKKSALDLIASRDPNNPDAKFEDHQYLYGEFHPFKTKLEPATVFSYLVEKGLFRIGAKLTCPSCRMASWTALDVLKQRVVCEMCGGEYDSTRQLVKSEWHYRRSGVLGTEKNAQGAVPVVLTLQQLDTNLGGGLREVMYSPSLDLEPKSGANVPRCEVDFIWVIARSFPRKSVVILGECKDQGMLKFKEFAQSVENLRRVANALPRKRFKTFVLLAKLCPFTPEEIEIARTLNEEYRYRAILLTSRELEPYHIFDRTKQEFDIEGYGGTPEDLAQATANIYFKKGQTLPGPTNLEVE